MNKLLLTTIVAVAASVAAFGQVAGPQGGPPRIGAPGGPNQRGGPMAKRMQDAIKAAKPDKDQQKKIREFMQKYQESMKSLREDVQSGKIKRREAAPKLKAATDTMREGIKKTLTADQWKAFEDAMKAEPAKKDGDTKKSGG